ncbi:hypothetical protein F5Y15DRAFT_381236 [Xylariaceae sp. FL0016]|nr:hypothetical protein F5Y15DRAFT_381236 [Xylariaceae sp. FL0016]
MGVAYFGRSRARLGWTAARMVGHFAIRAVVLTLISVAMGLVFSLGQLWFLNVVLFALGADYFLAGLLWLAFNWTEPAVARAISAYLPEEEEEEDAARPLIAGQDDGHATRKTERAFSLSWHLHNALLLILAGVTISWNIWLSPDHGHCDSEPTLTGLQFTDSSWFRIWFYPVQTKRVVSGFPPLAWLSFAILGLLYGRLIIARSWSPTRIRLATLLAGLAFGVLFVLTRIFHFGNLSEGCLQTAEHTAHPNMNQYLTSPEAFFYVTKYPPDVAFFAYTMACNLLLLAGFDLIPPNIASHLSVLIAYGTSALFFYLIHQYLLMGLGSLVVMWFGHDTGVTDPLTGSPGTGVDNLWLFVGTWAVALAILFPLCQWYSKFKKTKGPNSLWRFF